MYEEVATLRREIYHNVSIYHKGVNNNYTYEKHSIKYYIYDT